MPSPFSKLGGVATTATSSSPRTSSNNDDAPPPYTSLNNNRSAVDGVPLSDEEINKVNLTEAFDKLTLNPAPGDPDVNTCLAHLKLLFAIQSMKEEVGYTDGLWNIWDIRADRDVRADPAEERDIPFVPAKVTGDEEIDRSDKKIALLSKIREKRWAVYLARAVDRYEAWWSSLQVPGGGLVEGDMQDSTSEKYGRFVDAKDDMFRWLAESLPPLDVVMVWHAHMLNPRAFLEDTMLAGLRQFWYTGMPWLAINGAIDNKFNYAVSDDCKARWVERTGRSWDNADDPMTKSLPCPACETPLDLSWTTCGLDETYKGDRKPGLVGNGYGDGKLIFKCPGCAVVIDKELLSVSKFANDTLALLHKGRPMPGTVLDPISGLPEVIPQPETSQFPRTFPNRLIKSLLSLQMQNLIHPKVTPPPSMSTVRTMIEAIIKNNSAVKRVDGIKSLITRYRLDPTARITIRKMMSRYWENFSPFALDLAGAVLRQGTFIDKMVKIDWLHSPSAAATMSRLLTKYSRFFAIMASNPKQTVVPTLDVDLAWHTHQLSPAAYYAHSLRETKATGAKYIDHDDKIEEGKLSSAFEWTSKTYQEKYGEVYSECTCWYCEAVRTSHVSSVGKLLGSSKNEKVAENFHSSGAASFCPPDKSAHISSHNAVHMMKDPGRSSLPSRRRVQVQMAANDRQRLDDAYEKARRRAEKKGRRIPDKKEYYDHWGYQYACWGPYMYPVWFTPGMYYAWPPGYVAGCGGGAWAACAAGTCGGGVAAGSCGGPGGCGGGGAAGGCGGGGCGGGGGGGCGGGGGGGCGGGGGG